MLNDTTGLLSRVPVETPGEGDKKIYAAVDSNTQNSVGRFPRYEQIQRRWECVIGPGDCLRIPRFFWHNVVAPPGEINLGLNFWFSATVRIRSV